MIKKILFISSSINNKLMKSGITGGEVRLAKIMKGFLKKGWEVHFLTNGGGETFCNYFGLKGVINHNIGFKEGNSRFWVLALTFYLVLKPIKIENFEGVIYSANELLFDVIPAIRIKLNNKKNKWVAVAHWMPPLKFWQRKKSTFLNSLLFMISERLSVFLIKYFADRVLAVSESTKRQLIEAGVKRNKVIAVDCGVDLKNIVKVISKIKNKKYDAVFMKRIQAVKGVFDLIEIWEKVVKYKPEAKLAIIGGGADNKEVLSLIKEKKLEKNIIFFGPIFDFEKKFKILASSKIFILPSYEENWAIVIGEALASKVPVICYDLKELREVWKDSVIYTPLGDTGKMAKKILELLHNSLKRKFLSKKGFEFVKRYEWNKIAKNEVKIINQLNI
ncbi:MAG: glycosyltransferase family 4 protein [Microgenomates group bacterium]